MACSLAKAYVLISTAIVMLGTAIALAWIFFNVPGLAAAIVLVIAVIGIIGTDYGMIDQIRIAIREYVTCMGPSTQCKEAPSIDLLGKVPMVIGVLAWIAALAIQISALAFLASFFASWLGVPTALVGEVLKISGTLVVAAGAVMLTGLLVLVRNYEACRDKEVAGRPGPGGPIS